MTHPAAVATHTMTPVGQEGHGNVMGGLPLAGSLTRGAGVGSKYGIRPHGDESPAIRRLASQVTDAAPEILRTGVNVLVRDVTRGDPARTTSRNTLLRMKSV
jgi:hypothetical protein